MESAVASTLTVSIRNKRTRRAAACQDEDEKGCGYDMLRPAGLHYPS
jgi:hypothetical protein